MSLSARWLLGAFALACLAGARPLAAAEYHVCDCGAGADPDCQPGTDTAAGTDPAAPWRTFDRAQDAFAGLAAGDGIRFCRGGSFAIAGSRIFVNASCRADNRCRIEDYTAPWSTGDEAPPLLTAAGGHGFAFIDPPPSHHDEGYVVRNLHVRCVGCQPGDWGVFLSNDVDDVLLDSLTIEGFDIGVHLAGSAPCGKDPACDARNSCIVLRGSTIQDNRNQGWLGSGDGVSIEGNRFLRNGTGTVFQHNVYWSVSQSPTFSSRIVGNELYKSAAAASGRCEGGTFATHGTHTDLLIEGNYVHEDVGAADPACWGLVAQVALAEAEAFVRLVIRGNRVVNLGNVPIGVSACVDCSIENNVVVSEQPFAVTAIAAPTTLGDPADADMARLTVRNNSVSVGAGGGTGIRVGSEGSGHVVVGNALLYSGSSPAWNCFDLNLPISGYLAVDNSVCGTPSAPAAEWEEGSGSLSSWQAATGFDLASLATTPGFASPGPPAYDLTAAGPNAAMVALGHPTRSAPTEHFGHRRQAPADAGAHQIGQSGPRVAARARPCGPVPPPPQPLGPARR